MMHQWQSRVVWACERGQWDLAMKLMEEGHDIEQKGHCGWTVLVVAAARGHMDTVRYLVEHRTANLESRDDSGRTAILWAAAHGQCAAVEYLIAKGAHFDSEACDNQWRTPAAWAAQNGFVEVVEILASKGADLNIQDKEGNSPITLAATRGRRKVVAALAAHGIIAPHEYATQDNGKMHERASNNTKGSNASVCKNDTQVTCTVFQHYKSSWGQMGDVSKRQQSNTWNTWHTNAWDWNSTWT